MLRRVKHVVYGSLCVFLVLLIMFSAPLTQCYAQVVEDPNWTDDEGNPWKDPEAQPMEDDSPGFFNIGGKVANWVVGGINKFLMGMLKKGVDAVLGLLDRYIFTARDFTTDKRVTEVFRNVRTVAVWLFALMMIFALLRIMFTGLGLGSATIRAFLPRAVMGFFILWYSDKIVTFFVEIDYAVAHWILGNANSIQDLNVFNWIIVGGGPQGIATSSFMLLALLAALVGFFLVAIILVIRYVALGFLVCIGCFAGLCFVDERASRITVIWWRVMLSTVFLMSMEALIIALFISFGLASSADSMWQVLGNCASVIALSYLAVKVPAFFLDSSTAYIKTAGGVVTQPMSLAAGAMGAPGAAKIALGGAA